MSQHSQHEDNVRVYRGEGEYDQTSGTPDESYAYTPQLSSSDFKESYRPHEEWRQKVSPLQQPDSRSSLSAGQRLALAIVSVSVLVPLVAILIEGSISSDNAGNPLIIGSRLIALLLVCLTIMVVNLAFNRNR